MKDDFSREGYIALFGAALNDPNWWQENLIDGSKMENLFNLFYLSDKTMDVLRLRYNMNEGHRVRTFKEVAEEMNIAIATARYHEQKAFKNIRKFASIRHMIIRRENPVEIFEGFSRIFKEEREILEMEKLYLEGKDENGDIRKRLSMYYNDRLTKKVYEKDILMQREKKHRELIAIYGNSVDCNEELFVKPFKEEKYVLPFEIEKFRARASIRELKISFDFLVELHYSGFDTIDDLESNLYNNPDFFDKFNNVLAKDKDEIKFYISSRHRSNNKGFSSIIDILDYVEIDSNSALRSHFRFLNVRMVVQFLLQYDYLTHTWKFNEFTTNEVISKIVKVLEEKGFTREGKPFI